MSKMKCHYEILSISRDATDDEIKKSYRKLALKYHPDKNLDNIDECTKVFHLIQQAYDILIDPQERAWYDKHREAILKGGLGRGDDYQDDCLDVYQYFNTTCYSGFGDDEKGFYSVYREIFKQISAEDEEYKEDSDSETPEFGQSDSNYEEVVGPFYGYWESYCTRKSYVWVEKYDTREAPHRQVRRAMEQENKKLRDKAKKERNEEVRALVAFVRKRDRRVQAYKKKLEERAAEITRRTKEKKQKDRQDRLKAMEDYKEADWCAMTELEDKMKQLEADYDAEYVGAAAGDIDENNQAENAMEDVQDEDEDELYYDELYCVACNKAFKTDKAFLNHEKSKKHKENVASIKQEMIEEEQLINSESNLKGFSDSDEQPKQKLSKKQKKKKRRQQMFTEDNLDDELDDEHSEDIQKDCDTENSVKDAFVPHANSEQINDSEVNKAADVDDLGEENISGEKHEHDSDEIKETLTSEKDEHITNDSTPIQHSSDNKPQTKRTSNHQVCNVCKTKFPTRNKLFSHIKETGHALRLEDPVSDNCDVNQKKGKKKKSGKR